MYYAKPTSIIVMMLGNATGGLPQCSAQCSAWCDASNFSTVHYAMADVEMTFVKELRDVLGKVRPQYDEPCAI